MYQPLIAATFEDMIPVMGTSEEQKVVDEKYPECENISVDYAILEKAEEIFVFPADFGWSDLGTWGSLQTLSKKDDEGNAIISQNVRLFESSNCIVNVEGAKQVAIQGLNGYIVAERDGRLLICKLADEQRIKEFSK